LFLIIDDSMIVPFSLRRRIAESSGNGRETGYVTDPNVANADNIVTNALRRRTAETGGVAERMEGGMADRKKQKYNGTGA
jgi:hypothetical protein